MLRTRSYSEQYYLLICALDFNGLDISAMFSHESYSSIVSRQSGIDRRNSCHYTYMSHLVTSQQVSRPK